VILNAEVATIAIWIAAPAGALSGPGHGREQRADGGRAAAAWRRRPGGMGQDVAGLLRAGVGGRPAPSRHAA